MTIDYDPETYECRECWQSMYVTDGYDPLEEEVKMYIPEYVCKQRWDSLNEKAKIFYKGWLLGSTCHRKKRGIEWVSDCGQFLLLKHYGHSSSVGRNEVEWCPTYFSLYNVNDNVDCFGEPDLWRKEGRWKKYYINEILEIVNGGS